VPGQTIALRWLRHTPRNPMINVIALTQFAFLTLGIVSLKIMLQSNGTAAVSHYLQTLNGVSLWLFAIPLIWIAFASACFHINRGPLKPMVGNVIGVALAVLSFLFLVTVTFLPSLRL
jgi:hypothetical protein